MTQVLYFEMLQQLPLLTCIFITPGVSKIIFLFLVAINTKFVRHFWFFSMFIFLCPPTSLPIAVEYVDCLQPN